MQIIPYRRESFDGGVLQDFAAFVANLRQAAPLPGG